MSPEQQLESITQSLKPIKMGMTPVLSGQSEPYTAVQSLETLIQNDGMLKVLEVRSVPLFPEIIDNPNLFSAALATALRESDHPDNLLYLLVDFPLDQAVPTKFYNDLFTIIRGAVEQNNGPRVAFISNRSNENLPANSEDDSRMRRF